MSDPLMEAFQGNFLTAHVLQLPTLFKSRNCHCPLATKGPLAGVGPVVLMLLILSILTLLLNSLSPCWNMYKTHISSSHQSWNSTTKWGGGICNLWVILWELPVLHSQKRSLSHSPLAAVSSLQWFLQILSSCGHPDLTNGVGGCLWRLVWQLR